MPKPTLVSLAVAAILDAKGEQLRPWQLADLLLVRNPDHFACEKHEYDAQNPGKSVTYQVAGLPPLPSPIDAHDRHTTSL
jgi:hypothetical protein